MIRSSRHSPWAAAVAMILAVFAFVSPCLAGNRLEVVELPTTDPLNVRTAPGIRNPVVLRLAGGVRDIVATGRSRLVGSDKWVEVTVGKLTGWVNARFLKAEEQEPQVTPTGAISAPEKRFALIIGNSSYRFVPTLRNAQNDAREIAGALRAGGFDQVTALENASGAEMKSAIASLRDQAKDASLIVIYYAGHGLEINGRNFIVPVDARIENAKDVLAQALDLSWVLEQLDVLPGTKVVMLDACRDNPFRNRIARSEATRSLGSGEARNAVGVGFGSVAAGPQTIIAFAARDGSYALDGEGANSPFAEAIASHLRIEGLEIGLFFRRVRDAVLKKTDRKQEPFTYGSLGGAEVFLVPSSGGVSFDDELRDNNRDDWKAIESKLRRQTDIIVMSLKQGDFRTLADYIHPINGLMFDGALLKKADMRKPDYPEKVQTFDGFSEYQGYSDEKEFPMSLREYVKTRLYTRDFLSQAEVSLGERRVGTHAESDPAFVSAPGSIFVEYYVPSREAGGTDWETLRLILTRYNGRWFLTGILKKAWTP